MSWWAGQCLIWNVAFGFNSVRGVAADEFFMGTDDAAAITLKLKVT